ncbi:MAG: hypothetical protein INR73_04090 [Williamsia sp.]|nr:hypothetical protein [Williamsia sp.]
MSENSAIQYLTRDQIDGNQWNACIHKAPNGLIYAYTDYLDAMAKNWDALVLGSYQAVMPLPWNKKWGFYYLYQPFLCASLGVFGEEITASMLKEFLQAIPRRFRLWDMYFNYGNFFPVPGYELYQRISHVLDLRTPYDTLYADFRTSYKTLLKRFDKIGCTIKKNIPIEEVLQLTRVKLVPVANVKEEEYSRFTQLYKKLAALGKGISYGAYSPHGELLASGVFLFSNGRAYYIVAGNHADGRTVGASHQVINTFIREHAGRELLLDFEGSDVHNIAFFFKSFGAVEEKYPGIFYNKLPRLVRWLKKR